MLIFWYETTFNICWINKQKIIQALQELVEKPFKEINLAFISTAADLDKNAWYVKAARDPLVKLGFNVNNVDLKINPKILKNELEKSNVIFINGGNTFYLLEWVRKSGLDEYLKDLIEQGKVYIGASAGSVLIGPNIELAGWAPHWDKNVNDLQDLSGLNFVSYVISPHYQEGEKGILEKGQKSMDYKIMPITDAQAVVVEGEDYKVVGEDEVIVEL